MIVKITLGTYVSFRYQSRLVQKMSDFEVVAAFLTHTESIEPSSNFQQYWSEMWKPITQKCLLVAKHQFIMQKAFEQFKGLLHDGQSKWSDIFVHEEEEKVLISLCKHVGLDPKEFLFFGFSHHSNRCRKHLIRIKKNKM